MTKRSSLLDQPDSFGWLSISFHWMAAVIVTLMWFIGMSIAYQTGDAIDARRSLHVILGLIVWLPLAARIVWRLYSPHPHVRGQSSQTHKLARLAHYLMLLVLGVMLLSGPLLAWALPESSELADAVFAVHSNAAIALATLVGFHIAGALRHLMFHNDETIERIFVPRKTE